MQNRNKISMLFAKHSIPTDLWEKGSAKSIDDFIKEVELGESTLKELNNKLTRLVSVAAATIYYNNAKNGDKLKLIEVKQVFSDGRERVRDLPISVAEKFNPANEQPREAIIRGLKEELAIKEPFDISFIKQKKLAHESHSYPGLQTVMKWYYYKVNLSEEQFNLNGYKEKTDSKISYFEWIKL